MDTKFAIKWRQHSAEFRPKTLFCRLRKLRLFGPRSAVPLTPGSARHKEPCKDGMDASPRHVSAPDFRVLSEAKGLVAGFCLSIALPTSAGAGAARPADLKVCRQP